MIIWRIKLSSTLSPDQVLARIMAVTDTKRLTWLRLPWLRRNDSDRTYTFGGHIDTARRRFVIFNYPYNLRRWNLNYCFRGSVREGMAQTEIVCWMRSPLVEIAVPLVFLVIFVLQAPRALSHPWDASTTRWAIAWSLMAAMYVLLSIMSIRRGREVLQNLVGESSHLTSGVNTRNP